MENSERPEEVVTFTAPVGGVVSGGMYLIGSLLVVAAATKAAGEEFEGAATEVFELPKVALEEWTELERLYYDATPGVITDQASGNILVGVAAKARAAGLEITSDALAADLALTSTTIQVLDFAALPGASITLTTIGFDGSRVSVTITEGVDWDAAVSDELTAVDIEAAVEALPGYASTVLTDTVTITEAPAVTGLVRLDGAAR